MLFDYYKIIYDLFELPSYILLDIIVFAILIRANIKSVESIQNLSRELDPERISAINTTFGVQIADNKVSREVKVESVAHLNLAVVVERSEADELELEVLRVENDLSSRSQTREVDIHTAFVRESSLSPNLVVSDVRSNFEVVICRF